jgi:hypothetical protein
VSRATYVAIAARLGKGSALAKPRPNCSACSRPAARGRSMRGKAGVRPDLGVGEALAGAARDILHQAGAVLDDRTRPQASAVHEYRKDMKRWRALLRLLAALLGAQGNGLWRQAPDLARELAPARDARARRPRRACRPRQVGVRPAGRHDEGAA